MTQQTPLERVRRDIEQMPCPREVIDLALADLRAALNDEYMRGYNAAGALLEGMLALERAALQDDMTDLKGGAE